jgi:uncharacterized protein (DUF58 family)
VEPVFKVRHGIAPSATMKNVPPTQMFKRTGTPDKAGAPDGHAGVLDTLNTNLFEVPRFSPAHEPPATGIFHSRIVSWLWKLWTNRLSTGGRYFLLATALFGFFGLASLELQAMIPLAYSIIVWVLAYVAMFLEKPRVSLTAHHSERIAAGAELLVEVEITQLGSLGGGGAQVLPSLLPNRIDLEPAAGANLPPMRKGDVRTVNFVLKPQRRGVYRLRGYRVETDFPFGIYNAARIFPMEDKLTVYPRFEPLDRLNIPLGRRYQPGGVAFTAPRGESTEYVGNRDYREGDEVRHIDWRATARLNRPIIREYREEYFLRSAVVLDTHLPRLNEPACDDLERAISLCAACGDYMNRADFLVDILAAGPNMYHLLAGRGPASLDQMLDILACVEPSRVPPWQTLEPEISQNLEQISSVVCLFLDWDEERRAFATRMLENGAAVKIIVVRDRVSRGAPSLDPATSWPAEIHVVERREFEAGIRFL